MKWTHKIVHKEHNDWWFGALIDGKFHHNGLHEVGEKPRLDIVASFALDKSIEEFYNNPLYEVKRLNIFKGNK